MPRTLRAGLCLCDQTHYNSSMTGDFLPVSRRDIEERGWSGPDILFVSADAYVDHPSFATALLCRVLEKNGFRVAIAAQPDWKDPEALRAMGRPRLCCMISGGNIDSMVAHYTSTRKKRSGDMYSPGGKPGLRPDRPTIVYSNLVRQAFGDIPVVIGGLEASLRRFAHYDYWTDSIRRPILFDAKADGITYGMAELSNLELARRIRDKEDWHTVKGICYATRDPPFEYGRLASFEECISNRRSFSQAFRTFYYNSDPLTAMGLSQKCGDRYLVQNPPQRNVTSDELDRIYGTDYENAVHPYYLKDGPVKAMDTIKNSITTHRGCYGECSFCAIAMHQGRTVISRSAKSIIDEATRIASRPDFNGIIYDVGGPTANMWQIECPRKLEKGACQDRKCLFPRICPNLPVDHRAQIELLQAIKEIPGVKKVFVASGVRYDMVVFDETSGQDYVDALVRDHVSGQMKVAPEHIDPQVLELVGKPEANVLLDFKDMFEESCRRQNRDLYLTYYFMAALPGCGQKAMKELGDFCRNELHTRPEQVQVFTPTPSTAATAMYYSLRDFDDGANVWCEKTYALKLKQKEAVTGNLVKNAILKRKSS